MKHFTLDERYIQNIHYDLQAAFNTTCYKNHWGDENFVPYLNKLYLITEGSLHFDIDGKIFEAGPGDLLLLPLHTRQFYSAQTDSFNHYWAHLRIYTTQKNDLDLMDVLKSPCKITLDEEHYYQYKKWFDQLVELYPNRMDLFIRLKIYALINEMIMTYFKLSDYLELHRPNPSLTYMIKVMDYIKENMDRHLTIEEMAEHLHLHPNYFIRLFKNHFGQSPIKYINNVKMKKACEDLLLQKTSVHDIAHNLGYTDVFYFSRLFKKYIGMSPSKYRQKSEGQCSK